nr:MAG TPA: hypothetical protein [Crassvirales sp.]
MIKILSTHDSSPKSRTKILSPLLGSLKVSSSSLDSQTNTTLHALFFLRFQYLHLSHNALNNMK